MIDYFNKFPFAYSLINEQKEVLVSNEIFKQFFPSCEDIKNVFSEIKLELTEQEIYFNQKFYRVFCSKDEENFQLYFIENPNSNKIFVSLIFIDNYEEVLSSLEEFRQPLLMAVVDRKIKKMVRDIGGIIREFEKDRYLFISTLDKIDTLKENKFSILESIREIDMGNKIPVTLSIGIGINGESLEETMEFARTAIDLSLSRGGDQAIIKDKENYQFFGGHAKEIGINSRVRARIKASSLIDFIEESKNVIIMGHKNSDLDCFGAGIGMFCLVSTFEKKCNIVLNNVTSAISSMYDKIIKNDKYQNVFVNSDEAKKLINRNTLLIVVDTFKPSICEDVEIINKAKKIVVFDHHRKGVEFIEKAVLTYHEPFASSTCELITEMIMYSKKTISLKNIEADAILAGITIDTKNFSFKTGIKTFEAAAFLRKKGADTMRVKKLFKNSMSSFKLKANAIQNAEIFNNNIAISFIESSEEDINILAAQTADELITIENIEASFVLSKMQDTVYISARSLGSINVQRIMEMLGGGGHQLVSATQIKGVSIKEAIESIKQTINIYLEEVN